MKDKIRKIIFATANEHKVSEVSKQLIIPNIEIISLKELNFTEDIPETADTFQGNALQKSQYVYDVFTTDVFSEDTGLEVTSLEMAPGVYSARYAGAHRSDDDNMDLLLKNLLDKEDRSARFKTVISLIFDDQYYYFEGIVNGKIAFEKTGNDGFGYDPIFIPDGHDRSFAHFTKEEKNEISHRGRAVKKLIAFLNKQTSSLS